MAIYFVDPYKKYHDELSEASNLVSSGENMVADSLSLVKIGERLQMQLEASMWQELGYDQLVTTTIPNLKKKFKALNDNLTYLQLTCTEAIGNLLPLTTSLKDKDELYEKKLDELKNLKEPSQKYVKDKYGKDTGQLTEEYARYESTKMALEEEIFNLKEELEKLVLEIKNKIDDIKNISANITSFSSLVFAENAETNYEELEDELELIITDSHEKIGEIDVLTGALTYNNGKTLLYNDVGTEEDGYRRLIYTSHGKMITVFKQMWAEDDYFLTEDENGRIVRDRSRTLRLKGCAFHALASILSSKYADVTPEEIFEKYGKKPMLSTGAKTFLEENYNIKVGNRYEIPRSNYEEYKKHLTEEVAKGNFILTTVEKTKDKKYTSNVSHWVVVVDYDAETDQFYVSDSGDKKNVNYEPIDVDTFLKKYSVNTNVIYIEDDSAYYNYAANFKETENK